MVKHLFPLLLAISNLQFLQAQNNWLPSPHPLLEMTEEVRSATPKLNVPGEQSSLRSVQFAGTDSLVLLTYSRSYAYLHDRREIRMRYFPAALRNYKTGELIRYFVLDTEPTEKLDDIMNPQTFAALPARDSLISAAAYIVDGKQRTRFLLWNRNSSEPVGVFKNTSSNAPFSIRPIPDGKRFLSVSKHSLELWDIDRQSLVNVIDYVPTIQAAGASPDGRLMFVATGDREGGLDIPCGQRYQQMAGYLKKVAGGLNDLSVISTTTGMVTRIIPGGTGRNVAAMFLDDGRIVTADGMGSVRIRDRESGDLIKSYFEPDSLPVVSLAVSPDRRSVLFQKHLESGNQFFHVDVPTQKIQRIKDLGLAPDLKFSPSGKYLLSAFAYSPLHTHEKRDGYLALYNWPVKKTFRAYSGYEVSDCIAMSPDETEIVLGNLTGDVTWMDPVKFTRLRQFRAHASAIGILKFSPDGQLLITAGQCDTLKVWSGKDERLLYFVTTPGKKIYSLAFSPDGSRFYTGHEAGEIGAYETGTGKRVAGWQTTGGAVSALDISPDGLYLISGGGDIPAARQYADFLQSTRKKERFPPMVELREVSSGKLLHRLSGHSCGITCGDFSPDGRILATGGRDYSVRLWNTVTGAAMAELSGHSSDLQLVRFFPDGRRLLSRDSEGWVLIWDTETQRPVSRILIPDDRSTDLSADGNSLMAGEQLWDLSTLKHTATFRQLGPGDWLTLTPDGYYFGTPVAINNISVSIGKDTLGFEDFDLHYNRPDLVLTKLGCADTDRVNLYRLAYQKRLAKAGVQKTDIHPAEGRPVVEILNRRQIPSRTDKKEVILSLRLSDRHTSVRRLHVWLNDVPLYGRAGMLLPADSVHLVTVTVPLNDYYSPVSATEAQNTIQITCVNASGISSFQSSVTISSNYFQSPKSAIHFIGVGTDHYSDSSMNLRYSAKDIQDLAAIFRKLNDKNHFIRDTSVIVTLLNEAATRENILAVRERLRRARPSDVVVLALSGHGMLNDSLDFYYATHDMDFDRPEERGLSYADIENLLDSLPTLQKILLIDACHSGDVDKYLQQETRHEPVPSHDVKEKSFSRVARKKTGVSDRNAFLLMQQVYAHLAKGTGTFVISAAGGREYALEGDNWRNGVFTYSFIQALGSKETDVNKDKIISLQEVADYVRFQVIHLTKGRQVPTIRKGNYFRDFGFLYYLSDSHLISPPSKAGNKRE